LNKHTKHLHQLLDNEGADSEMKTEEDVDMSSATLRKSRPARNQRKKAVDSYNSSSSGDSAPTTRPTTSPYYDDALRPISHPRSPEQLLVTTQHPVSLLSFLSVFRPTSEDNFAWAPQPSTPFISLYDVSSGSYPNPSTPHFRDPEMQSQVSSYCLVAPLQELWGYE